MWLLAHGVGTAGVGCSNDYKSGGKGSNEVWPILGNRGGRSGHIWEFPSYNSISGTTCRLHSYLTSPCKPQGRAAERIWTLNSEPKAPFLFCKPIIFHHLSLFSYILEDNGLCIKLALCHTYTFDSSVSNFQLLMYNIMVWSSFK